MNLRKFFITNTWWGKLIGSFFGYLVAGSLGSLFGLLVGNFFDRGLSNHFSNPYWLYLNEKNKTVQNVFFEATFSIIGYLAKADGRVSEAELNRARSLMNEMRLNDEEKKLAKILFNQGKQVGFKLNELLKEVKETCKDKPDLLRLFINIQYRSAQIDGLSAKKIQALDLIFSKLGFAPFHQQYRFYEDFSKYYSQEQKENTQKNSYSSSQSYSSSYKRYTTYNSPKTSLEQAYALIQVSPESSKQEVKRAYRCLLSRNHPDKLIAQGLSQEVIRIANEKTQNIVKAYELICSSKGW